MRGLRLGRFCHYYRENLSRDADMMMTRLMICWMLISLLSRVIATASAKMHLRFGGYALKPLANDRATGVVTGHGHDIGARSAAR